MAALLLDRGARHLAVPLFQLVGSIVIGTLSLGVSGAPAPPAPLVAATPAFSAVVASRSQSVVDISTLRIDRDENPGSIELEITPEPALAQSFDLPSATGVLVVRVEDDSPALVAGLAQGDAVLSLDGKPLMHFADLPQQIAQRPPGSSMQLEVWRRGIPRLLQVSLRALPAPEKSSFTTAAPDWNDGLGLSLDELAPVQRLQRHVDSGLLVREASGLARSEGIRAGDIVVALNTAKLHSLDDFRQGLGRAAPGKTVALLVMRDRRLAYVAVRLPARPGRD